MISNSILASESKLHRYIPTGELLQRPFRNGIVILNSITMKSIYKIRFQMSGLVFRVCLWRYAFTSKRFRLLVFIYRIRSITNFKLNLMLIDCNWSKWRNNKTKLSFSSATFLPLLAHRFIVLVNRFAAIETVFRIKLFFHYLFFFFFCSLWWNLS